MSKDIYLVGGYVRDTLLNKTSKDIDFACEMDSYKELKEYLIDGGYNIRSEEPQFFRIKARPPEGHPYDRYVCDFLLCRSDGHYSDGRRPDSVQTCDIRTDLSRRDLTCNAIAINYVTGEILDPYKGRKDIEAKVLRPVGDVAERVNEDPLRLLRYIRFASQLRFSYCPELASYLLSAEAANQIKRVHVERIRQELVTAFSYSTLGTLQSLFDQCHRDMVNYIFGATRLWLLPTSADR